MLSSGFRGFRVLGLRLQGAGSGSEVSGFQGFRV